MFGAFRFLLAILVVIGHLAGKVWTWYYGIYAVVGFYIVSGYLMTLTLQRTYGFALAGSTKFWANRLLRILPLYYCVAVATLALVMMFPAESSRYHESLTLSFRPIDIAGNLLVVPFEFYHRRFRLIPPAWSVAVELLCYLLLWSFTARDRRRAAASLLIGAAYLAYSFWAGWEWQTRYFPVLAAVLPFSIGSLLFHYREAIGRIVLHPRFPGPIVMLGALGIHLVLATVPRGYAASYGFYVNFAMVAVIVAQLSYADVANPFIRRADGFLGTLSYPVFLVHVVVGLVVFLFILPETPKSLKMLAIGFPLSVTLAFLLTRCVDEPIQRLRVSIRSDRRLVNRGAGGAASSPALDEASRDGPAPPLPALVLHQQDDHAGN